MVGMSGSRLRRGARSDRAATLNVNRLLCGRVLKHEPRGNGEFGNRSQAQAIIRCTPGMLTAATAIGHQLVLATRKARYFLGCGVQRVNPFEFS